MADSSQSAHGASHSHSPEPHKTFYSSFERVAAVLSLHHVPQHKIESSERLVAAGRLCLETIVEVLLGFGVADYDPTSPLSFAARRVFAYTGLNDFSVHTAFHVSKYLDAIHAILILDTPEFADLDIDIWIPESPRTQQFCAAELSHQPSNPDDPKIASPSSELILNHTHFGADRSAPEGYRPLTKSQQRRIGNAMELNDASARARFHESTKMLFGTEKHEKDCKCEICHIYDRHQAHSNKLAWASVTSGKLQPSKQAFDTLFRLYPNETARVFANAVSTDRYPWEIVSDLTALYGLTGMHLNGVTDIALDTVKTFWQKYAPKGEESGPMDRTEGAKTYKLEESEHLAQVIGMFVTRLKDAAKAKIARVHAKAEEQKLIFLDDKRTGHERLIASVEHRRLHAEIDNIEMRVNISQVRMFNMENRYGCNVEVVTRVLIEHLKLPGGEDEDPVGILEQISEKAPRAKQSKTCYGLSLRQILNEPMILCNQLALDIAGAHPDGPFSKHTATAGPSSEKTPGPASQPAEEGSVSTGDPKKKSRKSKKGKGKGKRKGKATEGEEEIQVANDPNGKGKATDGEEVIHMASDPKGKGKATEGEEETHMTSDPKGKGKATEDEEGIHMSSDQQGKGKAKEDEHSAQESNKKGKEPETHADAGEKLAGLAELFDRHEGNKRHIDALTKIMELNLKRAEKVRVSNALLGEGGGSSSTKLPIPPEFHFQGELVPTKGVPKKVLEAIWNLDFLLEELPGDEQKVKDLHFKVANSIQLWGVNTSVAAWQNFATKLHELPLTREYMIEREALQEEVLDAHCQTIMIIKFLKGPRGKTVTIPDGLLAKLYQFGESLHQVRAYWAQKLSDVLPTTPEEILEQVTRLRKETAAVVAATMGGGSLAMEVAAERAAAGEGKGEEKGAGEGPGEGASKPKQWWEHVLEKQ